MTEFEIKRIKYFIKAAKTSDYVQLGPGDIEMLEELLTGYGWAEGQGYEKVQVLQTR